MESFKSVHALNNRMPGSHEKLFAAKGFELTTPWSLGNSLTTATIDTVNLGKKSDLKTSLPGSFVTNFPEKSFRCREKIFRPDVVEVPLEVFAAEVQPQVPPGRDVLFLGHLAGFRVDLVKVVAPD